MEASSPGTGAARVTGATAGMHMGHHASVLTQRFWRLREAVSPFVWRGLLPLLGLGGVAAFAVAPFATNEVEATVAREVRSQLQQQGFGWVKVTATGQEVRLAGSPPEAGAGDKALVIARGATCPTWAGPQVCAVTVLGAFGNPAAGALPSAPTLPSTPAPPAAPTPPTAVATPPAAKPSPAAIACEAAFAKLLGSARIEFSTGGSTIDARSASLLDRLAETARGCPGRILIEGHTDNVGDVASNQRLSEARAAAVRSALMQRGVPDVRLETLGLGDTKPLADNGNAAGRAANRRIDFRALP